jgi:hypothetical protein
MTGKIKGLPVAAYHAYMNGNASMDIRLFSLFSVAHASGNEMDTAETVTYFNDLCIAAPGALVDDRIKWEEIGDNSVKAIFTNSSISITAFLLFNPKGELINFISDDRYYDNGNNGMKKVRWSTPVSNYKGINGHMVPTRVDVIWSLPERDFCYGKFHLLEIRYNNR